MGLELLEAELSASCGSLAGSSEGDDPVDQEDIDFWSQVTRDIAQNAHTAVEILNDLLNYDKLESGTLNLEMDTVSIFDLVQRTVQQFQIQAVNRQVDLKLDMDKPKSVTPENDIESGSLFSNNNLSIARISISEKKP